MFKIYDCFGVVVGRSDGYKTQSAAFAQVHRKGRIKAAIWAAYDKSLAMHPGSGPRLVYKIRLDEKTEKIGFNI